jgi:hypothetical protein
MKEDFGVSTQSESHARHAHLCARNSWRAHVSGAWGALLVLCTSAHAQTAEPLLQASPFPLAEYAPLALDAPFGTPILRSGIYRRDDPLDSGALSFFRKVDSDDLQLTSFVASRAAQDAANYRVYVGLGYRQALASFAKFTARTFYGAGTYDGNNADGSLPEEVRSASHPSGAWLGSNWQLESRIFEKHTFSAGVEYRQQVEMPLMQIAGVLARNDSLAASERVRKVGFTTRGRFALASGVALNVRARVDEMPMTGAASPFEQQTFEVGMERSGPDGSRAQLSYAWQSAIDSIGGSTARVAQQLTKLRMDIPGVSNRLQTGFELQYLQIVGPFDNGGDHDYLIGNLTLAGHDLTKRTHVSLGLNNLFGARETVSGARLLSFIPPDGRSVRLDLVRKL